MELKLIRKAKKETYTIGDLYVDDVKICNTLEDKDRGLKQTMFLDEIKKIKIHSETAIPTGIYTINMNTISPKYGKIMPRLEKVPGYEGILIHSGNTAIDSAGCILVGDNNQVGRVNNSKATFDKLFKLLEEENKKGNKITISIENG